MARFGYEQADNFGQSSNGSFFSLKNDGDVARVKFMYNGMQDIEGMSVHQVEIDGKRRYVNCLREYNDPVDVCPFCQAKMKVYPKVFVQMYDVDADEVKIWDRGKSFFQKISPIAARYNPLVAHTFEIERHGKAGDMHTDYAFFEVDNDNATLEDLPEPAEILGGLVLDKTADEMEFFLHNDSFPGEAESTQAAGGRSAQRRESSQGFQRRTPANRNGDVY